MLIIWRKPSYRMKPSKAGEQGDEEGETALAPTFELLVPTMPAGSKFSFASELQEAFILSQFQFKPSGLGSLSLTTNRMLISTIGHSLGKGLKYH